MRYFQLFTFLSLVLLLPVQAEEKSFVSHSKKLTNKSESGLEVRVNILGSSGRFRQDFTLNDISGNALRKYHYTSDLTTKGGSLLLGYAREYRHKKQSSFLYIGVESQKWNDAYDSIYKAFVVGAEGGIGSQNIKFIYGGEFAGGALATGSDGLGHLTAFTAEPYVGMRFLLEHNFSINMRAGARFYSIESVEASDGVNTLTSVNSAYTANAQVGLGYSFY